jgi:hypothetical protein
MLSCVSAASLTMVTKRGCECRRFEGGAMPLQPMPPGQGVHVLVRFALRTAIAMSNRLLF